MALLKNKKSGRSSGKANQPASSSGALPSWIVWGRWVVPLVALLLVGGFALARNPRALSGLGLDKTPLASAVGAGAPKQFTGKVALINGRQVAPNFTLTD